MRRRSAGCGRRRVARARDRQSVRLEGTPFRHNADMSSKALNDFCPLTDECRNLLRVAIDQLGLGPAPPRSGQSMSQICRQYQVYETTLRRV